MQHIQAGYEHCLEGDDVVYDGVLLGDLVLAAGGDYDSLATRGGVVAVHIQWLCDLDWDFQQYCLPKYVEEAIKKFKILDIF